MYKKIFRLIYPYLIYTLLGSLLLGCVFIIYKISAQLGSLPNPEVIAADKLNGQVVYWTAVSAVLASFILYHFYKKDQVMRVRSADIRIKRPACVISAVFLGVFSCIFGNYLVAVLGLEELSAEYEVVSDTLYSIPFLAQIICIGVCIPLAEEFVFRILGFRRLRDTMHFIPAAFLSALLFGLYHENLVQAVYASILGLIIAAAYELCDNIWIPVMIHISANIFSVALTALPEAGGLSFLGALLVMLVSLLAVAGILYRMGVNKSGI